VRAWWRNFVATFRAYRALEAERGEMRIMREALARKGAMIDDQRELLNDERERSGFYRAWFGQLDLPLPPAPLDVEQWTPEDAAALKGFIAGGAGQKLVREFRRYEAQLLEAAAMRNLTGEQLTQACGFAAGFRGSFAYWIQLSATHPPHQVDHAHAAEMTGDEARRETDSPE